MLVSFDFTETDFEFVDRDRKCRTEYFDFFHEFGDTLQPWMKEKLLELIEKDPDYFDSYVTMAELLEMEGNSVDAEKYVDTAFQKAENLIKNKDGLYPNRLYSAI